MKYYIKGKIPFQIQLCCNSCIKINRRENLSLNTPADAICRKRILLFEQLSSEQIYRVNLFFLLDQSI